MFRRIKCFFNLQNYFVKIFAILFFISIVSNILFLKKWNDDCQEFYKYQNDKRIVQEEIIALSKAEREVFLCPIEGKVRITSNFGKRISPISRKKGFHSGIDIATPVGTCIRAAATGKVIYNGWKKGYGWIIIIRHRNGYVTVYAHNKYNYKRAKVGNWVKKGETIAISGATGAVTGPHLHFEIRKSVNPKWFFEKE